MELTVAPEDLHAAAVALAACARHIDAAVDAFARASARAVPDLGRHATAAAGDAADRAQCAAATVATDVDEVARALRVLAQVYADTDRDAVHR